MFTKTTEYALRATILIARESSETNKVGIDFIAASIGSPRSFTAKILQKLSKDNAVVTSVKGPNGGFYIDEKARASPIAKVLEAMGELDVIYKCVLGLPQCSDDNPCPMHEKYRTIKPRLIALFNEKTIGDLADSGDWLKLKG